MLCALGSPTASRRGSRGFPALEKRDRSSARGGRRRDVPLRNRQRWVPELGSMTPSASARLWDACQPNLAVRRSSFHDRKRPHHVVIFMFDDVTVVHILLRRAHAVRQRKLRPDGCEMTGVRLDRVLEPPLFGGRGDHGAGGEGRWSIPPGTPCGPSYASSYACAANGVRPTTRRSLGACASGGYPR